LPHFNRPIARHVPRAERWRTIDARSLQAIPAPVLDWIALPTSLTAHLAAQLDGEVRVRVLSERHDRFLTSERDLLCTPARTGRVREVQLEVRGTAFVVARTVFPSTTARVANRALMSLGTRALGSLLFGAMRAPASLRQYAKLCPRSSLWRTLHAHLPAHAAHLWARRALHRLHGEPLLVTEIFLPALLDEKQ
jgi:chorismate--pyruvate lyase